VSESIHEHHTKPPGQLQLERLVFFSDAVFAIAITLLVLEIKLPELPGRVTDADVGRALLHVAPKIVGFIVSFLVIAAYWEGHHRMFALIERVDRGLMWRNLLLLLTVSFSPFPTALFSEYPSLALPLRFYAISLAAVGVCSAMVWRYATQHLLVDDADAREVRRLRNRTFATPLVCLFAMIVSTFSLPIARVLLILIPVAVGVGDRLAGRRR